MEKNELEQLAKNKVVSEACKAFGGNVKNEWKPDFLRSLAVQCVVSLGGS